MKTILTSILFIFGILCLQAQDTLFFLYDTVKFESLVFEGKIPLNEQGMLNFYQTSEITSLDKINARLPGVFVVSRGPFAMEPVLNSLSGGQISVTVDGMHMFGACTDRMDPVTSYIEPDNLDQLQISHGPAGASHTANVGGGFNMIPESPEIRPDKRVAGRAAYGYESISSGHTAKVMWNLSGNKLAWRSNIVYRNSDTYADADGNSVPFSQYRKANAHNSLLYAINSKQTLKFDYLVDIAQDVGYPALPMDVSRADARIYSLEYHRKPTVNAAEWKAKIYANTVYHVMDDSQRDSLFFIEDPVDGTRDSVYMHMDMPGWSNTAGAYLFTRFQWGKQHSAYIKLDNYTNQTRAEMTMYMQNPEHPNEPPMYVETWPDNYRVNTSLYAENSFQLHEKLNFTAGIRIDYAHTEVTSTAGKQQWTVFGYELADAYRSWQKAFRLNLRYQPASTYRLVLAGGYNERLPTQSEQFGFYLYNAYDGYDYLGNPDLKTEKAWTLHAGFQAEKGKLRLNANGYVYYLTDYIFGTLQEDIDPMNFYAAGIKQYTNLSYATIWASDLLIEYSPIHQVTIYNSSKYVSGYLPGNTAMPLIPPLKNLLAAQWSFRKLLLLAEWEYNAAQERINSDFGESTSSAYSLLNLRVNYVIPVVWAYLKLSSGMENVFNKLYSDHLDWGNYYRPGRNFYLEMRISF